MNERGPAPDEPITTDAENVEELSISQPREDTGGEDANALEEAPREIARVQGAPFRFARANRTIMGALLQARSRYGGGRVCIIDADERRLTYTELVRAAFALGRTFTKKAKPGGAVGVLLPTGAAAAITFFGLTAYGRIPAMLNFTAGARALRAACAAAQAGAIVTARRFVELGNLQGLIDELETDHEIIYLEDVRKDLRASDKAAALAGSYLPWAMRAHPNPGAPAVYLFTSGTEGDPKGVVLSHANIVGNAEQARQHIPELYPTDVAMNPLPTFHCFGLTGGLILPLLAGFPSVMHPTPLQAKTIVQRVRDHGATILFATDTFFGQYARAAADDDLKTLRFAVCGAERVKDETRTMARKRFKLDVLEGYGVTECAPVIAVNQPSFNKPGTVGRLLPGVEARLESVPGINGAGRLLVRGPNVMQGYISADEPGVLKPLAGGWHDTGDIVSFDEDGCITIRGRHKRFAKIGGEMVSLAVVENCATSLWPDNAHAAIAVSGSRKGEQILLVTDCADATKADIAAFVRSHGVQNTATPEKIIIVEEVPILGTGKIDYAAVQRLATENVIAEKEASA